MLKKTLVFGASENKDRYAYMAVKLLVEKGYEVVCVGNKKGKIDAIPIEIGLPMFTDIHTITLYINPKIQENLETYFLSLHPKRIIFNPGTENDSLAQKAKAAGIEVEIACSLVLLRLQQY